VFGSLGKLRQPQALQLTLQAVTGFSETLSQILHAQPLLTTRATQAYLNGAAGWLPHAFPILMGVPGQVRMTCITTILPVQLHH
jgi:hypothetical protein